MAPTVFVVLVLAASAAAITSNFSGEGQQAKSAITFQQQLRWTNRLVPYVLDRSVASYTSLINQAMRKISDTTCVRFVPRTYQRNYVKIFPGEGCYHYVGMTVGEQPLSLGQGCMHLGIIVHHLVGTLGFYEEHIRSDRDDFLDINEENIQAGLESQFQKLPANKNLLLTAYDYNSIMQLGSKAFSANGQPTMVQKGNGRTFSELYEKENLSASDIQGIRTAYNC